MPTLIYLLQVSACTGIFYLLYKGILSRYTFFTLNRWYLLTTLVISFAIPLISIPANAPQPLTVIYHPASVENVKRIIASVPMQGPVSVHPAEQAFNWLELLPWLYLAGAAVLALHLLVALIKLVLRLRGTAIATINGVKIIQDNGRFKNGSFMNYIFLNDDALTKEELQQVLDHELTHVRLMHSADRILARLVQVIMWFNPFSYWYSRAIEVNHEFEVDQQMAGSVNRSEYANLLVRLAVSPESSLYHHFSMIPLKKRIAMLFNNPTKNMKKIIYLLALPLVVIGGLAFGNRALLTSAVEMAPVPRGGNSGPKGMEEKISDAVEFTRGILDKGDIVPDSGIDTPRLFKEAGVKYSATDSTLIKEKIVLLYGNARVSYEDFDLSADFIRLDQGNNTVYARGVKDPKIGRYIGRPIFKRGAIQGTRQGYLSDGDTIEFRAKDYRMRENAPLGALLERLEDVDVAADKTVSAKDRKVKKITVDGKSWLGPMSSMLTDLPGDIIKSVQFYLDPAGDLVINLVTGK